MERVGVGEAPIVRAQERGAALLLELLGRLVPIRVVERQGLGVAVEGLEVGAVLLSRPADGA
jgi:hypothetical protein